MRKFSYLLVCMIYLNVNAQTSDNYTINEKFVFHQFDVIEKGTEKVLETYSIGGVVVDVTISGQNYLGISIPRVHDFNLIIANKVTDTPTKDLKLVMYQGGEKIKDIGTYTANVFFVYNLNSNSNVPELIRLELDNAPNIFQFSGIIKLDN